MKDYQQIVLNMSEKELQTIFGISPKPERKSRTVVELYKQYSSECHYCTPSSPTGQISFGNQQIKFKIRKQKLK